jgi:hypothetical protein
MGASFLRGEISAVETYRMALEKLDRGNPARSELEACMRSHQERVALLRDQIKAPAQRAVGKPLAHVDRGGRARERIRCRRTGLMARGRGARCCRCCDGPMVAPTRPGPARPGPTRPDPARSGPIRPDPARSGSSEETTRSLRWGSGLPCGRIGAHRTVATGTQPKSLRQAMARPI